LLLRKRVPKWKEIQMQGDFQILRELIGVSDVAISNAVNHGTGSLSLLQKIDRFYREREAVVAASEQEETKTES
jgi:hypothetical protein